MTWKTWGDHELCSTPRLPFPYLYCLSLTEEKALRTHTRSLEEDDMEGYVAVLSPGPEWEVTLQIPSGKTRIP